jgi:hypothetical protein
VLAWLFLAAFVLHGWADGSGGGSGSGTAGSGFSPGEEGNSLPVVGDSHGLTLMGSIAELRAVTLSVQGQGQIDVVRVARGVVAVTLVGDYRVQLDRAALARSNVAVLFRGGAAFQDGIAMLQIGASAPMVLDPERVPLPVARLAASPRAQGNLLTLDVQARGRRALVSGDFATDRVTLTQRFQ